MEPKINALPREIFSGHWKYGHCQGIAVDSKREAIYYSFTTTLVKTDLNGRLIGSVTGLLGHLGCIGYCDLDGRVYGSLEYKNDAIGRGILQRLGSNAQIEDAFYIAIFDADRIDRPNMDACADGVMTTVYLREVAEDFSAQVECGERAVAHRHGCSGIDGMTFGPIPGSAEKRTYLFVSYGIYSDLDRDDNDDQVLLCYDPADWAQYEQPLVQSAMHRSGPEKPFSNSLSARATRPTACRIWNTTPLRAIYSWRYTGARRRNSPIMRCTPWTEGARRNGRSCREWSPRCAAKY